jgi:hypothetical protein
MSKPLILAILLAGLPVAAHAQDREGARAGDSVGASPMPFARASSGAGRGVFAIIVEALLSRLVLWRFANPLLRFDDLFELRLVF